MNIRRTQKREHGTWCYTSEAMAADSESRDTPYHLKYARQVSCMGCGTRRLPQILTSTSYQLCAFGKLKNEIQGCPHF